MVASEKDSSTAARNSPSAPPVRRKPRLAYLTTSYPEVSQTFIRREIEELERAGYAISRAAIREPTSQLVDADDLREVTNTYYTLSELPKAIWRALGQHPVKLLSALVRAVKMGLLSHRGVSTHLVYLAEALTLKRRFQGLGVDHVHVHFGTNAAAVAQLIHLLGGPSFSMTVHGPTEFDSAIGFGLGAKIEDAAFVVAITEFCGAQLRRWVAPDQWSKIRIVHCAVEADLFAKARPIDPESKTLVCVGRLTPQKGQLLLLEAVARVIADGVDLRLVLAGDGEMRPEVETRIRALGLEDSVEITGWIDADRVVAELQGARAMVLPSFAEGLPVVIMEALALERPVVSTYIAGIPELVRPGQNGWLIPAGSVDALTEALHEAMRMPISRLDEMGKAGAEAVRRDHHLPTEVARLAQYFEEVTS